ncbi:MAG: site-2 protease family protein [Thermodesulfobacteriota bacterium]
MADFLDYFRVLLLKAPVILLALTVHEYAHAWVAKRRGDNTAYMLGRVTLNPIKHLDLVGTIMLFFSGLFGWAKPVPVNPRNFKNPSRDMMVVSIAGPLANIVLAAVFAVIYSVMSSAAQYSEALLNSGFFVPLFFMVKVGIYINVGLAIFNMLPIPPLDGSKVLYHFLPANAALGYSRIEPYGFFILLFFIVTGALDKVMGPIVYYAINAFMLGGF